jgi:hypothetical protein
MHGITKESLISTPCSYTATQRITTINKQLFAEN